MFNVSFCETWHRLLSSEYFLVSSFYLNMITNLYNWLIVICFFISAENGNDVLIDVDNKDRLEILNHVIRVLGKPK